jgi:hypothetical protein
VRRHRATSFGLVVGLFVVLTLLFTYPVWVHPATTVLWHGSDTELFAWTLSWDVHALTHHPWSIFEANIYFPQHHTLAYSENLIGSAILAAPVLWLTGNPIVAINFLSVTTTLLCALGAFVLARRLGAGTAGAIVAGIVFGFAPPRFFRLGQLHLAAVEWVPFGLAALHAYLDGGRRRDARLTAGFFTLQTLSSGHGTVFLILSMLGLVVWRTVLGEPLRLTRRLRDLGLTGLLLLLPAVVVLAEYQVVQHETGLARTLNDWVRTNGASFFTSPSYVDTFVHDRLPGRLDPPQADLFPGYLPLLLAPLAFVRRPRRAAPGTSSPGPAPPAGLAGAWRRWRARLRRDPVVFYGLLTVLSVWVALPLEGPFALWPAVYWLPGLNFIRVPSRFTILAMLGLAVLCGLGVDRVTARCRPRWRVAAGVVIAVLLGTELAAMPLRPVRYRIEIPAVDRWLALRPGRCVIAEMPAGDMREGSTIFERRQSTYMLHSMAHWQKTIHGYSGTRVPLHDELYRKLGSFPDPRSLASLARVGVTCVVVHPELYDPGEWPGVQARLDAFGDWLTLDRMVDGGRIYILHAPR